MRTCSCESSRSADSDTYLHRSVGREVQGLSSEALLLLRHFSDILLFLEDIPNEIHRSVFWPELFFGQYLDLRTNQV